MKKIGLIIVSLFMAVNAFSSESIAWDVHGFGPQHHKDEADGITIMKDGFTYIAGGFSNHFRLKDQWLKSEGKRDIFLAKIDPLGSIKWVKTYATANDENVFDLTSDEKGNLYLNGYRQVYENKKLKYSALTMKVNPKNGRVVWSKLFSSPKGAGGNEITTDSKGNIYATYISKGGLYINGKLKKSEGSKESHIVKMSPRGIIKWSVSTKGRGNERVRAISTAYNDTRIAIGFEYKGEIKVKGTSFLGTSRNAKQGAYLILDENGNKVDFVNVENSSNANVRGTGGFKDGIYIYGTFSDTAKIKNKIIGSYGARDTFLAKLNKNGRIKWMKAMNSRKDQDGGEIAINKKGEVYITGDHAGRNFLLSEPNSVSVIFAENFPERTAHLLKFSPSGKLTNKFTLAPSSFPNASGVIEVNNQSVSFGIRFYGEVEIEDKLFQAGDKRDKDFVIVNFEKF